MQACASYSPPTHETIRSAEYYADSEEYYDAYDEYAPDVTIRFADAAYYPWWSVDYFYLGPHYYRPAYWPGPRYSLGYRHGFPPNYWSYYGFYSPFYYPYSTYAWYDPWYGWPRYGIGTNLAWQQIYWTRHNSNRSRAGERRSASRDYGTSRYENYDRYGDAFNDPRDRAGSRPGATSSLAIMPGTNTGSMQVRNRGERKIGRSRTGSTAAVNTPGAVRQSSRAPIRPTVSPPRPSPAPRPGSNSSSKAPDYQPGKKRKN